MLKKQEIVAKILANKQHKPHKQSTVFCPANIALAKYWGKRDSELNLPTTSSLSIALPHKGATTTIAINQQNQDKIWLNNKILSPKSDFYQRITQFLELFRPLTNHYYLVKTTSNIPTAAGLASSASGFAALISALKKLYHWPINEQYLSILARLGSGSAARSLWNGFVKWHQGSQTDGMDSFAEPLTTTWPDLKIGLLIISQRKKTISSRLAMAQTTQNSYFYEKWTQASQQHLQIIEQAIINQNFDLLGKTVETNALGMHATMLAAWPPICYSTAKTLSAIHKIWQLRAQGIKIYFTQDAGPNLKLLFLEQDAAIIAKYFPFLEIINLFPQQY